MYLFLWMAEIICFCPPMVEKYPQAGGALPYFLFLPFQSSSIGFFPLLLGMCVALEIIQHNLWRTRQTTKGWHISRYSTKRNLLASMSGALSPNRLTYIHSARMCPCSIYPNDSDYFAKGCETTDKRATILSKHIPAVSDTENHHFISQSETRLQWHFFIVTVRCKRGGL